MKDGKLPFVDCVVHVDEDWSLIQVFDSLHQNFILSGWECPSRAQQYISF